MRKINIVIAFWILVLLAGFAQPVCADPWNYRNAPEMFHIHVEAGINRVEGLLQAYSINPNQSVKEQVLVALNAVSTVFQKYDAAVKKIYPNLAPEEQLAVRNSYSSLRLRLQRLADRVNVEDLIHNKIIDIINCISI